MVALAALAHRLALSIFYPFGGSALQITIDETPLHEQAPDLPGSESEAVFQAQREVWRTKLPNEAETLLPWLLGQSLEDTIALLAFCAAVSVNGVQSDEGPHAIDGLVQATKLNIRE